MCEEVDHRAVVGRDVVRFPTRDEAFIDHDLLVDPVGAGIAQISTQRRQEVTRRPRATPASITVQGPWQIAATGLPASKKALTKATASGMMRSVSGLITPPGRCSAS